jgi:conjugative transfer signal peptidase TraF
MTGREAFRKASIGLAIVSLVLLLLSWLLNLAGVRINSTKSIPLGLYWIVDQPVEKGVYVLFCPPQIGVFEEARQRGYIGAGFCPGGYGYLMKRVLAANEDVIQVAQDGVWVNGERLPFSAPRVVDSANRVMPRYQASEYTLGATEVFLGSDVSDTSFDGRYYGPIQRSQIQAVIRPVLTW